MFHNDPLNIVLDIAPTTLKMDNFDKFDQGQIIRF